MKKNKAQFVVGSSVVAAAKTKRCLRGMTKDKIHKNAIITIKQNV